MQDVHRDDLISTVSTSNLLCACSVSDTRSIPVFHPHLPLTAHTSIARHTALVDELCTTICFRPLRVSSYELKPRRSQSAFMKLNGDDLVCTAAYTPQYCFSRFGRDKANVCQTVHCDQHPAAAVNRPAWINKYSSDLQVLRLLAARLQDVLKNCVAFQLSVCDQVRIKHAHATTCRPPRPILL